MERPFSKVQQDKKEYKKSLWTKLTEEIDEPLEVWDASQWLRNHERALMELEPAERPADLVEPIAHVAMRGMVEPSVV